MKKLKFTGSQVMEALKRVEAGLEVPEICREMAKYAASLSEILCVRHIIPSKEFHAPQNQQGRIERPAGTAENLSSAT